MPFQPAVSYQFNFDGTVTATDKSVYGVDGVTLQNLQNRTIHMTDGKLNALPDVVFVGINNKVTFPISKDYFLLTQLDWTKADSSHVTATLNYLTEGYYQPLAIAAASKLNCICTRCKSLCNNVALAEMSIARAEDASLLIGQESVAQDLLDAAYNFINQKGGCGC